jgi:hypothetical protein
MLKFFASPANAVSLFLIIVAGALSAFGQDSAVKQKNNSAAETAVAAAAADSISVVQTGKNEFSVQGGLAPDIPRVFGGARRSKFGFVAFRYSRRLIGSENVALKYTIDIIPAAVLNYDEQEVIQTGPSTFSTRLNNRSVYGFGVTPIGFQLNFRHRKKFQPFLSASAGLIRFAKTIPDDRSAVFPNRSGRQFNYSLAGGGGAEFVLESGKSITAGFKFHHISNAQTGDINPGFDQNLFYVGYTFKKW